MSGESLGCEIKEPMQRDSTMSTEAKKKKGEKKEENTSPYELYELPCS